MVPTLLWFDHFDERIGVLPTVGAIEHTDCVNGEDTLHVLCPRTPGKGDRLVWRDPADGCWREHVVVWTDEGLGRPCEVWAEGSQCELLGEYLVDRHLVHKGANEAMRIILEGLIKRIW